MRRTLSDELKVFIAQAPIARRRIFEQVERFAALLPEGTRVLDVGAGSKPYRELFAHAVYRSHDWQHSPHTDTHDLVGDIASGLDAPSGDFGAALLTEVLEHLATPVQALRETRRLLEPGGLILVTVPFVAPLHEEPHDYQRPTRHGLNLWLTEAGFEGVEISALSGWFGTLAQFLWDCGQSIQPLNEPLSGRRRVVAGTARRAARVLDRWAIGLDHRVDRRAATPLGWVAVARRPNSH